MIQNISNLTTTTSFVESIQKPEKGAFENTMLKGINQVNKEIQDANQMSKEFLTEGKHELHEVMIAMEQADLSFRLMTQVRNKVLDAYSEVMRIQV